jgi:hypothetical protein
MARSSSTPDGQRWIEIEVSHDDWRVCREAEPALEESA